MLFDAGTGMIGNDSDLSLTTLCVSDSSAPESEDDVLVLSAAAAGAEVASWSAESAVFLAVEPEKSHSANEVRGI
jgi:hypothetical protein